MGGELQRGYAWVTRVDLAPLGEVAVGNWEVWDPYENLVAALDQRIDASATEEDKSRWRRIRESIVGAGRDLVVDVLGEAVKRSIYGA